VYDDLAAMSQLQDGDLYDGDDNHNGDDEQQQQSTSYHHPPSSQPVPVCDVIMLLQLVLGITTDVDKDGCVPACRS
jgi:hypothetical protein